MVERVVVVDAAATARGVEDVVVARPRAKRSEAVLPAFCGAAQTRVKERKRGRRARKVCVGSMSAVARQFLIVEPGSSKAGLFDGIGEILAAVKMRGSRATGLKLYEEVSV